MENSEKISRFAVMLLAIWAAPACGALRKVEPAVAPIPSTKLSITQVGFAQTARFVYCEESACPPPTPKTLAQAATASIVPLTPMQTTLAIEVDFPLKSAGVSANDRIRLTRAAAKNVGASIEIIARSDFAGSSTGQKKLAKERAAALRRIVASQARGSQITERQEIAAPPRLVDLARLQQPGGTVRFIPSIDVPLKGTTK